MSRKPKIKEIEEIDESAQFVPISPKDYLDKYGSKDITYEFYGDQTYAILAMSPLIVGLNISALVTIYSGMLRSFHYVQYMVLARGERIESLKEYPELYEMMNLIAINISNIEVILQQALDISNNANSKSKIPNA